ncbi:Lsr2 family protein [Micropruina sp. KQZ13P-5]|nr:Lsr2 family protein [Micropruina sp. KQZ13P-5]MCW3159654.1 Lsr2 family protein [Micropruina sp. KQZ13P-5]
MARTTVIVMEDDLDGGAADQQVTFAIDGVSYEIDLNNSNADRLRGLLEPFVAKARRTGGRRSPSAGPRRNRADWLSDVRTWARANGHQVSSRGRIAQSVVDAYSAANPS